MDWAWVVLKSEFFWGVMLGLILSVVSGYALAAFQTRAQTAAGTELMRNFSIDTVQNIRQIIDQLDDNRNRSEVLFTEFLVLLEIEVSIFGRNREHLVRLDERQREAVRNFVNKCALKRAEVANSLDEFIRLNQFAQQLWSEGDNSRAQKLREQSEPLLKKANKATDDLIQLASRSPEVIAALSKKAK